MSCSNYYDVKLFLVIWLGDCNVHFILVIKHCIYEIRTYICDMKGKRRVPSRFSLGWWFKDFFQGFPEVGFCSRISRELCNLSMDSALNIQESNDNNQISNDNIDYDTNTESNNETQKTLKMMMVEESVKWMTRRRRRKKSGWNQGQQGRFGLKETLTRMPSWQR